MLGWRASWDIDQKARWPFSHTEKEKIVLDNWMSQEVILFTVKEKSMRTNGKTLLIFPTRRLSSKIICASAAGNTCRLSSDTKPRRLLTLVSELVWLASPPHMMRRLLSPRALLQVFGYNTLNFDNNRQVWLSHDRQFGLFLITLEGAWGCEHSRIFTLDGLNWLSR